MKVNLFFDPNVRGHIIEYLHHVYIYTENSTDRFIYVVSPFFKERCKTLEWPQRENVKIVCMTEREAEICTQSNRIKAAWCISKIINKYVKQEKATHVFLNYLMNAMPFVLFNLPKYCRISGIIYNNCLNKQYSKYSCRVFLEKLLYVFMANMRNMCTVFLLNDSFGADFLNKKLHSNKFKSIVDPINDVDFSKLKDLRIELGIPEDNRIFLQFGSLDKRKNTLTILDAVLGMSDKELSKITLIFAGRLSKDISNEFYKRINCLNHRAQVIVKEEFLPFEYLFSLCKTADCLFTCYNNVEQSSGTIGYASVFGIPVIGPSKGLLGKLIKENRLGITLSNISAEEIRRAMLVPQLPIPSHEYAENNTIGRFAKTIIDGFA